jgi:hypothetical protein
MTPLTCTHCGQPVEPGDAHDCWTTSEAALTRDLPEDLREAWERLREAAAAFGDQRIYASHHSIMFSRRACYCFVRPRATRLEVCLFLGRTLHAPQIRRAQPVSRVKTAHIVHVRHRDEVEPPLTDWMREAWEVSDALSVRPPAISPTTRRHPTGTGPRAAARRTGEPDFKRFRTAAAFERWLSTHHARAREVWIRMFRKGSGKVTLTPADALDVALCWGWIDGLRRRFDEQSFLQRYSPRTRRSTWSRINRGHVARLTAAGRMRPPGLRAVAAAKAGGRWT